MAIIGSLQYVALTESSLDTPPSGTTNAWMMNMPKLCWWSWWAAAYMLRHLIERLDGFTPPEITLWSSLNVKSWQLLAKGNRKNLQNHESVTNCCGWSH